MKLLGADLSPHRGDSRGSVVATDVAVVAGDR
jgi:hypothetical protein